VPQQQQLQCYAEVAIAATGTAATRAAAAATVGPLVSICQRAAVDAAAAAAAAAAAVWCLKLV
jgi:hypothetical protein